MNHGVVFQQMHKHSQRIFGYELRLIKSLSSRTHAFSTIGDCHFTMSSTTNRKTSVRTALAFVPPDEIIPSINAIRAQHDKGFIRWMPHMNVYFPFFESLELDGTRFDEPLLQKLTSVLSTIEAFECRLDHFDSFEKGPHVFLAPQPQALQKMVSIANALDIAFPELAEKAHRPFRPHLTVGQFKGQKTVAAANLAKDWNPIFWQVDRLCLVSRINDDPMVVRHVIHLKPTV
eukprot:m.41683 g.41683  ORF g.41683 m.41683 type:complete len:232 (+) comp18891_c0_seq1:275-970(+)